MLISYLKIAFRNLLKSRLTSFINIFGLGLSMSVGLMILIRFQDAFNYDKFHAFKDRIYRITSVYQKKNGEKWVMASTPLPLATALKNDSSTIESVVNVYPSLNGKVQAEGKDFYINAAFTQPSFFQVFGFSLLSGNAATALLQPNTIVISKAVAQKFFGRANEVLGKVIHLENGSQFIVTGVLNDAPGRSHLNYEAYASYASVKQLEKDKLLNAKSDEWYDFNAAYTYILLKKNAKSSQALAQLHAIAAAANHNNPDGTTAFNLQALSKVSPGSEYLSNDNAQGTSWTKIYIEAGMALLILLAAGFNYTNLTIARALTRAKEVGVRKIVGARRYQIYLQYIVEAILLSMLALVFAWAVLSVIVRYSLFNDDYQFIPSSFNYDSNFIFWSIVYGIAIGLLAGSVPAWILSSFKPLRVLKNLSTARILGKVSLQKTLIVFQYSLSLVVIIFLAVFYSQFSFMASVSPGFTKANMMVVPVGTSDAALMSQTIANVSGVQSVSASSARFRKHFDGLNTPVWLSNKEEALYLNYYYADGNFLSSMKFVFVAGKSFPATAGLNAREQYIVLNEKAAHAFGFNDSYKAVGNKLWLNDTTQVEVTGVLKDFSYENAGKSISPLAFRSKKDANNYLYVQTAGGDKKAMETRITTALHGLQIPKPFVVSWLSDDIDESNSQRATISLLGFLGFIALSVATLGLLGLVVYTVEVKGKEIGIRKVIGASEKQLVKMLSKGFIKLLFISGFIAMPIGWFISKVFLQNFSTRISFGVMQVVVCFLFLLGIGMFTVISQTYKAAIANPVKSLRTE